MVKYKSKVCHESQGGGESQAEAAPIQSQGQKWLWGQGEASRFFSTGSVEGFFFFF